ncbi:MAG: TonB family protein [Chitinivibrionales bacterium]|nr:TonB family protein [Chitinivibrionales bacterium]MBD3395474.1 TonB family protein [Chitinivibrionales bacterium]
MQDKAPSLKAYELYVPTHAGLVEGLFKAVLVVTVSAFLGMGAYFTTVEPEEIDIKERMSRIRARFVIEEKKPPVVKKEPKKVKKKDKPVDLSDKPQLKQKEDDIRKRSPKRQTRRIYGLKKVYSTGIGAGGKLSDAVIGKLGNTINKEIDDVEATRKDIVGELVSVTTVETNPRYLRKPRPEYTAEMRENQVEGVIKVKVLIDVDGKVKKAVVQQDLGYGSAEVARAACFDALFEPATRDGRPVAVWITIPIRFELLGT